CRACCYSNSVNFRETYFERNGRTLKKGRAKRTTFSPSISTPASTSVVKSSIDEAYDAQRLTAHYIAYAASSKI
ncbi:hypothetical protein ACFOLL_09735, partial [Falsochrobactrum ovis]|uniref:hypothetical protein n=1 Tax=Falsochrobactrum ovis TaxID=1293442 RepID=UPI00361A8031